MLSAGAGRPVLLLHGVPAGAALWGPLLRSPAPGLRWVAPDLPGFGASACSPSLGLPDMARWIGALRAALDLGADTVLVGQDWGGLLAGAAALEQGVRGLVLISAPLDHAWLGARVTALPGLAGPFYHWLGGRLYLASAVGPSHRAALLSACRITLDRAELPWTMRQIAATLKMRQIAKMRHDLKMRQIPTRLLWGGRDRMFPLRVGARTARALGVPLEVVPDAGQGLPFERPERVIAAVQALP